MCMEDLKIGRNTNSAQIDLLLSTTSQPAVPYDKFRTAIILGPPSASILHYSPTGLAVVGLGLTVTNGDHPIILTIEEHGELVRAAWSVVAAAGTPTASVLTTSYPHGEPQPNAPK